LEFGSVLGVVGKPSASQTYFTIFRAKVWKILIFEWILFLEIQKKLGLEGKISLVLNLLTLLNLEKI
jgi:hypothetical protein